MLSAKNYAFTKEQLFIFLENDRINVGTDLKNKAKSNDGEASRNIGFKYEKEKKDYFKAMAWYQLAANQNDHIAQINIGYLYDTGLGVSQDHLTAMEYYLRAAANNDDIAISNIGLLFLLGRGVSVDKYKALEWYIKSGKKPEQVKKLNEEGICLKEDDTDKPIHQLINEASDAIREERKKRIAMSNGRYQELVIAKSSNEEEIQKLKKELQKMQQKILSLEQEKLQNIIERGSLKESNNILEKQAMNKEEIVQSLKRENTIYQILVQSKDNELQSKNNEIDLLKKHNQVEQEVIELKRKMEEFQRSSRTPRSSMDNNDDDDSNRITDTTTRSTDNQVPHNNTPWDNVIVKTEEDDSISTKLENKKRRLSSNNA